MYGHIPTQIQEACSEKKLTLGGKRLINKHACQWIYLCNGARGVMVIVVGNGHGDTSLNPGRD